MKKIAAGKYLYQGYIVTNMGYYPPEKRVVWEAVDIKTKEGCYHAHTKLHIKSLIDQGEELIK